MNGQGSMIVISHHDVECILHGNSEASFVVWSAFSLAWLFYPLVYGFGMVSDEDGKRSSRGKDFGHSLSSIQPLV